MAKHKTNEQAAEPVELQPEPALKPEPVAGGRGLQLSTFDEMWRFANAAHRGGYAPRTKTGTVPPEDLLVRIQAGAEVGMTPMQSIQNIASINGRPCIWGDAMLGLCLASPHFSHNDFKEWFTGTPYQDDYTAHCQVRRIGQVEPHVSSFSVAMAKKAKLWGKAGPWTEYPDRMLTMRARTFACRDRFADVLKGISSAEEVSDIDAAIGAVDLTKTAAEIRDSMTKEPGGLPEPVRCAQCEQLVPQASTVPETDGDDSKRVCSKCAGLDPDVL